MLMMFLAFVTGTSATQQTSGDHNEGAAKRGGQPDEDNKALIQATFRDVIEQDGFDEQVVSRYFSPKYVQKVDGKTLDFAAFSDHLRALKAAVTNVHVVFEQMVAEGNKVMDIHLVYADKRAGGKIATKVISLYVIEDGKVVLCDELTHLEEGAATDKDMGSRSSPKP
jgi:ketosteroid isomerase-like protein